MKYFSLDLNRDHRQKVTGTGATGKKILGLRTGPESETDSPEL